MQHISWSLHSGRHTMIVHAVRNRREQLKQMEELESLASMAREHCAQLSGADLYESQDWCALLHEMRGIL